MSTEANEWLDVYDQTDQSIQGLASDIRETQKNNSASAPKERRVIARRLNTAKGEIDKLERLLTKMETQPIAYKIGEGELSRRRQMLSSLRKLYDSTDDLYSGKHNARLEMSSRKKDLLRGGHNEDIAETSETEGRSNREIADQQQMAIQKQDEKLDQVLEGLTTLSDMGHNISNELDLHKHLLSDLDNAVDATDERIKLNTARVETVNEKAGGCCGMLIMLFLLGIIVFLLASNQACHIFNSDRCD